MPPAGWTIQYGVVEIRRLQAGLRDDYPDFVLPPAGTVAAAKIERGSGVCGTALARQCALI
jgi:hypothetical protein